jgi:predicted DNA-binding transcriptional regulator YafY
MKKKVDQSAVLEQLQQPTLDSIWLGALLTLHMSGGEAATEARRLLDSLESMRVRTLDASAKSSTTRNKPAKAMTLASDAESLRQALIHENKLKIFYKDGSGRATERVVWPLDIEHYGPKGAMFCWCEKRQDFRNFRFDRVQQLLVLPEKTGAPRKVMAAFAQITVDSDFD